MSDSPKLVVIIKSKLPENMVREECERVDADGTIYRSERPASTGPVEKFLRFWRDLMSGTTKVAGSLCRRDELPNKLFIHGHHLTRGKAANEFISDMSHRDLLMSEGKKFQIIFEEDKKNASRALQKQIKQDLTGQFLAHKLPVGRELQTFLHMITADDPALNEQTIRDLRQIDLSLSLVMEDLLPDVKKAVVDTLRSLNPKMPPLPKDAKINFLSLLNKNKDTSPSPATSQYQSGQPKDSRETVPPAGPGDPPASTDSSASVTSPTLATQATRTVSRTPPAPPAPPIPTAPPLPVGQPSARTATDRSLKTTAPLAPDQSPTASENDLSAIFIAQRGNLRKVDQSPNPKQTDSSSDSLTDTLQKGLEKVSAGLKNRDSSPEDNGDSDEWGDET